MTAKRIGYGAAAGLAALVAAGMAAAQVVPDSQSQLSEVTIPSPGVTPDGAIRLTLVQVFFPGLPARAGCRMQIRAYNEGRQPVSFRVLVDISYYEKKPVNTWLIPFFNLQPNQEVLRLYSCERARYVRVLTSSPYAWPTACSIGGVRKSPCPLTFRVRSGLALPGMKALSVVELSRPPKKKKGGSQGGSAAAPTSRK